MTLQRIRIDPTARSNVDVLAWPDWVNPGGPTSPPETIPGDAIAPDIAGGDQANTGSWGWTEFYTPAGRLLANGPLNPTPYNTQYQTAGVYNPTDNYIGGRWEYTRTFTTGTGADVNSDADLVARIGAASTDDVIYIASSFTVTSQISINTRITIAGNRGVLNGAGPTLSYNMSSGQAPLTAWASGCRFAGFNMEYTGNRLVASGYGIWLRDDTAYSDASTHTEVDNMYFRYMTYAAVRVEASQAYVHHSNFEDLMDDVTHADVNYGVALYHENARCLFEANLHDGHSRHLVTTEGGVSQSSECRFNYVSGGKANGGSQQHFDAHGDSDSFGAVSGDQHYIHNNTVLNGDGSPTSGVIRGVQNRGTCTSGYWVEYNRFGAARTHGVVEYPDGTNNGRRNSETYDGTNGFVAMECVTADNEWSVTD
jgi:hypothetical protein